MKTSKEFLELAVKSIVSNQGAVRVETKTDEMGVLLTLRVHAEDMGKIIGKEGETAKALRTLLRVIGKAENARVTLKIEEPEGGRAPYRKPQREMAEDIGLTSF